MGEDLGLMPAKEKEKDLARQGGQTVLCRTAVAGTLLAIMEFGEG